MSGYFARLLTLLNNSGGIQPERLPLFDLFFATQNFAAHGLAPPKARTMVKLGCLDFVDYCASITDVSNREVIYVLDHTTMQKHRTWERDLKAITNGICPVSSPRVMTNNELLEPYGQVATISIIMMEPTGSEQAQLQELERWLEPYCDLILFGYKHLVGECWDNLCNRDLILEEKPQTFEPIHDGAYSDLTLSYGVIVKKN